MKTRWKLIGVTTAVMLALVLTASVALAFTQSNFISFTLEGCRNDGTITLPIGGKFICPDAAYTTGNLGKGWNELDLVPHRLTTSAGTQGGVTTDYDVYVAADYQTSGKTGYDVISVPTVNTAKSDASCTVSAGPQSTQGSAGSPFGGGTDVVIYRDLTIHQNAGTTCVFDYYQRLALGSHLYSGSSLQSYMFEQSGLTGSKKTISIPVNQILPQSLSKDMTATQGTDHVWNVTKSPTPATLTFGNSCDASQPTSQGVQITVSWTKGAADPSGPITVVTHVYATNPSARAITTNVSDVIRSGTTVLDTASASAVVPANTANSLILTHTTSVPSGTTNLNDVATGTYTDTVTNIPIPGSTTASASAAVQLSGPELNASATINDVENITGSGLQFSADSFTPAIGAFDGGYVAGTQTVGPVSWTSTSQSGSSSVTFNKTVYLGGPSQTSGKLSDTATLTGSDGFSTNASANVNISADARVSLTINKTITAAPGFSGQTFTFHVKNSSSVEVAAPTITFSAGDTSKSATVSNLAPGSYTVSEDPVTGWVTDSNKSASINLPTCSGSVSFSNTQVFSPSITTTPNPSSATVGGTLNDSATLSGGNNPSGNIVFNLYGPGDATCAGPALYNQTVAVSSGGGSTSPGFASSAVGTYHWTASYSGDTYNNAASSGCQAEPVTINKATPALTTNATGPVTVGQAIHDVATLTGGFNLTGSVTFDVFAPGDTTCSTPTNVPPAATVSGAGNYTSGNYTTGAVGSYRWIAHYSGDGNNNAVNTACNDANESSTANKASPSITTQASPTSGTVGQALAVGDTATFSGGFNPGGSVAFTFYSDNQCTAAVSGVSGSGNISGGSASYSTSWTPGAAGTYYWKASYAGDANNNGFNTGCGDANEQVVIGKTTTLIATSASSATVGSAIHDVATLSGATANAGGSITFSLYGPSATPDCSATAIFTSIVPVSGSGNYASDSFTPSAAGNYYWTADYSGDVNNLPSSEACGAQGETSTVNKASPSISTIAGGTVVLGSGNKLMDTANLSGGVGPTGTITFTLRDPSTNVVYTDVVTVTGNGNYDTSQGDHPGGYVPTATGTYTWSATYSGDGNNNGATDNGQNESEVVSPASPSITTQASPTSGTVGQALTVGDTATISGGFNPGGSISFTLYSNNTCTAAVPGVSGSGTISSGSASYSTSWTPGAAGTYYWLASYPGDANNNGFTTKCGDANEKIVIAKASPAVATISTNASGASTSVSDSATLSGGFNPTGSITFKLYGPSATASCTNLVFTSSAVTVNGNGTYGPVSFSPAVPGTYYWIASYSGDPNNSAVTGACGDTNETSNVPPGTAKVVKTVIGAAPTGTQAFTFTLRQGASVSNNGTILETQVANAGNGGVLNFTTQLVPGQHYQLCEDVMPGWNTTLGPNLFVPASIIPPALPNPNVNNMTVCTDFVAQTGVNPFTVDNTPPPGGRALTIGFWKNWASCTTSSTNKKPVLDQTLAKATVNTTNPPGGLVVSAQNPGGGWPNYAAAYYLILKGSASNPNVAPDCQAAVNLLSKSTINGKTKMASDPLFNMAAQLVAAQLNYFAGAGKNGPTTIDIQRAVLLLGKYLFNGNTYSPKLTSADTATANCLANQLNNYNNDLSVNTCP